MIKHDHDVKTIWPLVKLLHEEITRRGPDAPVTKKELQSLVRIRLREYESVDDILSLVSLLPESISNFRDLVYHLMPLYMKIRLTLVGGGDLVNIVQPRDDVYRVKSPEDAGPYIVSISLSEKVRLRKRGLDIKFRTNPIRALEVTCCVHEYAETRLKFSRSSIILQIRISDYENLKKFAKSLLCCILNPAHIIAIYTDTMYEIINNLDKLKLEYAHMMLTELSNEIYETLNSILSGKNLETIKRWLKFAELDDLITLIDFENRECIGSLCSTIVKKYDPEQLIRQLSEDPSLRSQLLGSLSAGNCIILWKRPSETVL